MADPDFQSRPSFHSRNVTSAQDGPHPDLLDVVKRHHDNAYRRPIAGHSQTAFEAAAQRIAEQGRPLILDSGCGTGHSTRHLAQAHPNHFVLGVDKSVSRLSRHNEDPLPDNALLVRADLVDFYRLAANAGWQLHRHYILYPNPWPKPGHLMRRWHGSPVFPSILALGGEVELRTNWQIYAEEFALALSASGRPATVQAFDPDGDYLTLFEKKYDLSGQTLFRLTSKLTSKLS